MTHAKNARPLSPSNARDLKSLGGNMPLRIDVALYPARQIRVDTVYGYVTSTGTMSSCVKITQVRDISGVLTATCLSASSGGMGPFMMTFDQLTGKGIGDYAGTQLVTLNHIGNW